MRASPEILTSTLLYLGTMVIGSIDPVLSSGRRPHFRGKIGRWFIDSFSHGEAHKPGDSHRRAGFAGSPLKYFCYRGFAVDDEDLGKQNILFVEFAHPAIDHFSDDIFGLTRLLRLILVN